MLAVCPFSVNAENSTEETEQGLEEIQPLIEMTDVKDTEGMSLEEMTDAFADASMCEYMDSETGFTFHVSYKLIAEDNGEEITVNDARVYVPANVVVGSDTTFIAAWQPNTKYTYTFKITENSTGTTDPGSTVIDVDDPVVPANPTVYPIVFDGATITDYTPNENEY